MNSITGYEMPECLYRGDPRVLALLGSQKPPSGDERIRRSCFVYSMYVDGKYLLFHTLTRQLLVVEPKYIDFFTDGVLIPSSILAQELPAKLYADYFLVPEHTSESQLYLELKNILVLKEELPKAITNYVILPTTACNARCFYCFEQGMRYQGMDDETVENTVRFILEHRLKENKAIHIHWFGGEPLCASETIDRICAALTEAGVEYIAEMTSNGSLFTEETVKKAADTWKLSRIQITLDGMDGEYAKRKHYRGALKNPFGTVIRNMHRLIGAGIGVTVRLNVDEKNLGEVYRVIDFLTEEFTEEEQKKLEVYAHSLFGQCGDGSDACPADTGNDALEARVLEINDYIERRNLRIHDMGALFSLKSHYCMVTAPECNVLIDAAGKLFACDAMTEEMCYGDVKNGIDLEAWRRVSSECAVHEECSRCVFLPQCTEFDRCPTRMVYDNCYRQEKRKLERELHYAYTPFQEQQFLTRKEASRVSD